MAEAASHLLRARVVLPVSRPPIDDGAVAISGNQITAVGGWRELSAGRRREVLDLGDVVLLPGLINAHCHLDYTDMGGQLSPPRQFTDWIKAITTLKGTWEYSEFAQSWIHGARMQVRNGTTTVADIEAVPDLLPDVWGATPLRVISFQELINVRNPRLARELVADAVRGLKRLPPGRGGVGLSPHALYTASPELLQHAVGAAREHQWRVTTHVAESQHEFEMLMYGRGEMYEWMKKSGRDMSDCGHGSPIQRLETLGALSPNFLAVHVNYLWQDDAKTLARHGAGVVHCPRSHAYFRHQRFPRAELIKAGVNVCLGTDSLASTNTARNQPLELNLFEEMRTLVATATDLEPETVLKMATLNAAKALGGEGMAGELTPGAVADLIAVPWNKAVDPYESVLHHTGDVLASMIDGHWAIRPRRI